MGLSFSIGGAIRVFDAQHGKVHGEIAVSILSKLDTQKQNGKPLRKHRNSRLAEDGPLPMPLDHVTCVIDTGKNIASLIRALAEKL